MKQNILKRAFNIGKGYFYDKETRKTAFILFSLSFIFELLGVSVFVIMNKWSNKFYSSLQNLDIQVFTSSIKYFVLVLLYAVIVFATKFVVQARFSLNWRQYITNQYIDKWLANKAFYGSGLLKSCSLDNPDQRISEDISAYASKSISIFFGFMNSIITLISFTLILWSFSGTQKFTILGREITIYGHLFWLALAYSIIVTIITYKIGKNLSGLDYSQEKKEANFRFAMMRLRENAENVALYKGEQYEKNIFINCFTDIFNNSLNIIRVSKNLSIWGTFNLNMANIVPLLASAPRLFLKEITFGDLMQIRGSFDQVQSAFAFFAHSITEIASYKAIIERLNDFDDSLTLWNNMCNNNKLNIITEGDELKLDNLKLFTPKGDKLLNLSCVMKAKNSYLIHGNNGIGKSTLIKALGGMWVFSQGKITFPKNKKIFFIPQKTYMPWGSLQDIICYPQYEANTSKDLLQKVNLQHLSDRFNNIENWSMSLSLGEQQKIAILRALIHKPDILIMDESTSAVTLQDQENLYKLIRKELPEAIIISVGHSKELIKLHDQEIKL